MTTTLGDVLAELEANGRTWEVRTPQPGEDPDERFWLTARGAIKLGLRLDAGTAQPGGIVCYSNELERWVRLR